MGFTVTYKFAFRVVFAQVYLQQIAYQYPLLDDAETLTVY